MSSTTSLRESCARRAALEDFFTLQLAHLRPKLEALTEKALQRKADARRVQHQAVCDLDLDQQPFAVTSAMGPRARTLSQLDGDE